MNNIERFVERQKNVLAKMLIDTDIDSKQWTDVVNWVRGAKTILTALEEELENEEEWILVSGAGEPWRYKCSYCKKEITDLRLEEETPDFCPHCGLFMKGKNK